MWDVGCGPVGLKAGVARGNFLVPGQLLGRRISPRPLVVF